VRQSIQQRIEQILSDQKSAGLNATKFGDICGVSKGRISQIRQDGAEKFFTYRVARKLNDRYGYSIAWVLDGEGPRLTEDRTADKDVLYIKWYKETRLAAGSGITVEEDGEVKNLAFREDWLREHGLNPKKVVAVHADGPSMGPRIQPKDLMLVNTAEKDVQNGNVYAFIEETKTGRLGRVKRLFNARNGALRIVSDFSSPEFPEETVQPEHRDSVYIIGRVVWIGGSV